MDITVWTDCVHIGVPADVRVPKTTRVSCVPNKLQLIHCLWCSPFHYCSHLFGWLKQLSVFWHHLCDQVVRVSQRSGRGWHVRTSVYNLVLVLPLGSMSWSDLISWNPHISTTVDSIMYHKRTEQNSSGRLCSNKSISSIWLYSNVLFSVSKEYRHFYHLIWVLSWWWRCADPEKWLEDSHQYPPPKDS